MKERLDRRGALLVSAFKLTALFLIGATIVWSAAHSYTGMTRFLAVDVKEFAVNNLLVVTASIIGLALAVLVLQIASSKFATAKAEATKVL